MSYMRGSRYLWRDDTHIHLWAEDGYDGWDDSVWFEGLEGATGGKSRPSGVQLSLEALDELVVMRLAQLLDEQRLAPVVDRALARYSGSGGCLALRQYAEQMKQAFIAARPT